MAERTEVANGSAANGSKPVRMADKIDPDDPEYQREMRRPADVKEDVKGMEARKRVSLILNSAEFRQELQEIVDTQLKTGPHPAALLALNQITELLVPQRTLGTSPMYGGGGSLSSVMPINDLRGIESLGYSKGERLLRCKLASLYRLVAIHGWTQGIYNHITVRINQEQEHFLLNPFGLLYEEVTAASLVKVDMQGEIVDPGSTTLGISRAGYVLHSAIHAARPDIRCIIHLHTPAGVAVSCMKQGLMPLSQEAMACGEISYHEYNGIVIDADEREQIGRDLGPTNKIMFLRNHGIVVCGRTIEEAWMFTTNVMNACENQIRLLSSSVESLVTVPEEIQRKVFQVASTQGGGGVDVPQSDNKKTKWRIGELEFEAAMRQLDNAGYRTGYIYRQPIVRHVQKKGASDVQVPPSAVSFTHEIMDSSELRSAAAEKQRKLQREHWLNTPNSYTRVESDETGTNDPKKVVSWVPSDGESPAHKSSGATKTTNPNLFAPQGDNPKEFKEGQQKVRKNYYEDNVDAGPQSKILEGTTWDEARQIQSGEHGDSAVVVVGAASKGIIAKEHQHNAQMYRQEFNPNPFNELNENGESEQASKDERSPNPAVSSAASASDVVDSPIHTTDDEESRRPDPVSTVKRSESEHVRPKPGLEESRSKSATLKSDSGADTLEEGSPSKADKKKKKGLKLPSFNKKKK